MEASALVQDGNPLSHHKRFDQHIETIPFRVLGTGNLQGGDATAAKTRGAELLSRRQLFTRIEDEPRWNSADYQRQKDEALAYGRKMSEERLRNPPTNKVVLPNPPIGPGMPQPMGVDS